MPRPDAVTERTCILTRETLPIDRLIRFVAAPDGSVVADLRHRLPGRGVWVTARADVVETAERRKLFGRAFGTEVKVEPGLSARVADALLAAAIGALSLARKAGTVVAGFGKVETALAEGRVIGLIHAAEAADDGVAKLAAAVRRGYGPDGAPRVVRFLTGEQLDLAFGRTNVIHAALLAGQASENTLFRVQALADFLGEDVGAGGIDRRSTEPRNLSAGF